MKQRDRPKKLRSRARTETRSGIVCKSFHMEKVLDLSQSVARVDSPVLITGESGAGKGRIARFLHEESPRGDGPLLATSCLALPDALLESELFGHVEGAFTGAESSRMGLLEAGRGGTVFLEEIQEMSPATQGKLLRALQERETLPLGATQARPIDVRLIAATSRDLDERVEAGAFRRDLYYRLKVVAIEVPPLRERTEDVLPLARQFLDEAAHVHRFEPHTLSPEAAEALTHHHWPGNVRELQNAMERAAVLAGDRGEIQVGDLPPELRDGPAEPPTSILFEDVIPLADLEQRYVLRVLDRFDGNRTETARALGIGANTLWRKLKSWGVPPARSSPSPERGPSNESCGS